MTHLFDKVFSWVEDLSNLRPVGMYSMGEQVAVALNRTERDHRPTEDLRRDESAGPGGADGPDWSPSNPTGGDHEPTRMRDDQPPDMGRDSETDDVPRPEGAPWDAVLLTGVGLPGPQAISDIAAQLRHEGRLIVLVTFTAPTKVDATNLADSWLEMNLAITAVVPSPTAILVLARRLPTREALLRLGRRELGQRRKTEWTQALGGCMRPEIQHKDEVFVQYGHQPGMGDVALIQTDDGLVAHRILARIGLGTASYVLQGGDRGGLFISPEWAILGKVTAVRSPGDDSPRILPNRPQPATRILLDLARFALPKQATLTGRILRRAYHQAQQVLQLAQKLDRALRNTPWPGKKKGNSP